MKVIFSNLNKRKSFRISVSRRLEVIRFGHISLRESFENPTRKTCRILFAKLLVAKTKKTKKTTRTKKKWKRGKTNGKKYFKDWSTKTVWFRSGKVVNKKKVENIKIIRIERKKKAEHFTFFKRYYLH